MALIFVKLNVKLNNVKISKFVDSKKIVKNNELS